ncbi:hypothetical protein H3H37_04710 [Duganella sp. LX20W]|uniref:Uncharacterized protein n=1 Tax=Rugamonas brunnea TaxID=2758569 RepID=A0A7W2EPW6_9BURK|nr:hypothetical protein [Rugamonas brunnea]MBA5636350.1 hypothetical protein [Rugamonas brunnea]
MNSKLSRHVWHYLLLLLLLPALAGSGARASDGAPPAPPAPTKITVALTQGQSATIAPDTVLRLERVNDSRCRVGAVCVWAGYISYTFTLTKGGTSTSFVLAADMPGASKTANQGGLTFTLLGVVPDSVPHMKAPVPDYRVSVQVSHAPAPEPGR